MAQYLLNAARTFIFSTAPPPPAVAGALAALELLEERPRLVAKLAANAAALRDALDARGLRRRRLAHPDRAARRRRRPSWRSRSARRRSRAACSRRRSRPPTVPADDLAAAPGRDGVPPRRGAAGRRARARAGRARGRVRPAGVRTSHEEYEESAADDRAEPVQDARPAGPFDGERTRAVRPRADPARRVAAGRPRCTLVVVRLEVPLARPAHGTEPGLGNILERRPGGMPPSGSPSSGS